MTEAIYYRRAFGLGDMVALYTPGIEIAGEIVTIDGERVWQVVVRGEHPPFESDWFPPDPHAERIDWLKEGF